ncbi:MAG: hypothetical protein ACWA5X_09935 [bacterium]
MKCIYYLSPNAKSTEDIATDLHDLGINHWFIHIYSKDEEGIARQHAHSANYLERLDILRDGILGAVMGFAAGLLLTLLLKTGNVFSAETPFILYAGIVSVTTLFGAWAGGLTGIATDNKKLAQFDRDIEAGKYLVILYTPRKYEAAVNRMMAVKHPEAAIAAVDEQVFNPLADLHRTQPN